jgi:hypothetical protein
MSKNITSLLLIIIPNIAYAHGITNEIVAIILLMSLWPSLIAIAALLFGIRKKRLNQNHKLWYRAAMVFAVIQILMLIYFTVTA